MELRAFAEQVLFASSLQEKLAPPQSPVSDDLPGTPIATPPSPGRPPELRFKDPAHPTRSRFPNLSQLDQPHERGRLLHFFANHELLAVELMALVLLRFPNAPPSFRRGVLNTLLDEQEHTRLYLNRMQACGIHFGDLPVSGFFWRAVSGMQSPVDYVAGLSLTFEQANLDFARHFAHAFRSVGDADSASLLDRIYHDEIAHVAYGLKWFRRWKNPRLSDWDAFCQQLRFPLSPQRAKGFSLNTEGRRAAGFDPDFIAHLEVFSQSKGRTPTVRLFNPFAEAHLANPAFTPNRLQSALASDLALLPMFLGHDDDIVLVPQPPPIEFLASIKAAGLPVPEFIPAHDPVALQTLARRKLGALRPWAWSPDSARILEPLRHAVTGSPPPPPSPLPPSLSALFGKDWSADFLRDFLAAEASGPHAHDNPGWSHPDSAGTPARSLESVLDAIRRIRSRGHHRVVIKESLGLAGSNALRLWEPDLLDTQLRWIRNRLAARSTLVVEPWLERVLDFSIQLERRTDGLHVLGYTTLITDPRGQFIANAAAPDCSSRPPARVADLLRHPSRPTALPQSLQHGLARLVASLETRLAPTGFLGPLGIDAFVHHSPDGLHHLKPVVEINPRHTMGRLTLELMRHVQTGSHARFQIVNRSSLDHLGFPDFPTLARSLQQSHPPIREGQPIPRLREGSIPLADPATTQLCLPILRVSRSPDIASPDGLGLP